MMKIGDKLQNGATIIAYFVSMRGGVVLADTSVRSAHSFATWLFNPTTGETFHGNYFRADEQEEAIADFKKRVERDMPRSFTVAERYAAAAAGK
jgi:hypothetical protein